MGYYRRRKSDARWKKVAWSSLFATWGVLGSLVLKSENPHPSIADADSEPGGEEDVATDAKNNFTYLEVSASRPQPDRLAVSKPAVSAASAPVEAQASAASQTQFSRSSEAAGTQQQPGKTNKAGKSAVKPQPTQPNVSSVLPGKGPAQSQPPASTLAPSISERPMLVRQEGADASMDAASDAASQASLPLLPPPAIAAVDQPAAAASAASSLEPGEAAVAIAENPLPIAEHQDSTTLSSYSTCSEPDGFKPTSSAENWLVSETRFSLSNSISTHPAVEQPLNLAFSDSNLGFSNLQAGKRCEIGSRLPMISLASN